MKRLLLSLLFATGCYAAGSVQQTLTQLGTSDSWVLTFRWIGDSVDGSVPVTPGKGLNTIQGYVATAVQVVPGTPSPTALYSVTLPDGSGIDILGGAATSLSPTIAASFTPSGATVPLQGAVSLTVAGQSVPSARGAVTIYFVKPSAFTIAQPTGATNVNWITQVSNKPFFDVRSFGATGDGAHADQPGVQGAINAACGVGGGDVFMPGGDYNMGTSLITVPCSSVTLYGARGKTRFIFFDASGGDFITVGPGSFLVAFRDFGILGASGTAKTSGWAIHETGGVYFELTNIQETGAPNGILLDSCTLCRITETQTYNMLPAAGIGMQIQGASVDDVIIDHFQTSTSLPGQPYTAGIKIIQSGYVSLRSVSTLVARYGLWVAPGNGQAVAGIESFESHYDTDVEYGILMAPDATGLITRCRFVGSWTSSAGFSGVAMDTTTGGRIDDVLFLGHYSKLNGQHGFVFLGANSINWEIKSASITNNSQSSPGSFNGINLPANLSKGRIQDTTIGSNIDGGDASQGYGIFVTGGTGDFLQFTNNDLYGNITAGMSFSGVTGTHNSIHDNPPYNPVGVSPVSCSASPCTLPIGPTMTTVTVKGGTVSDISVGGTSIASTTGQTFTVPQNASVVVTYSGTPTISMSVF